MKTTIAFKGTDPNNMEDWQNNLAQGQDEESSYYRASVRIGSSVKNANADVEITGHSPGGGLASGASRASGAAATTFNSAGLHDNTVARYGGTPLIPKQENIEVYQVKDEFLTGLQEPGSKGDVVAAIVGVKLLGPLGALVGPKLRNELAAQMPDALGVRHALPGDGNPITRHGMDAVIAGIESQKLEDQATIVRIVSS
jgi:hypothetical protein